MRERVIEALQRLCGFDLDFDPQDAKRLYELNIERLTGDFNAAIEEDRKSRECCKQEREACAKTCEDLAERHDGMGINDSNYQYVVTSAKRCAELIRARSES